MIGSRAVVAGILVLAAGCGAGSSDAGSPPSPAVHQVQAGPVPATVPTTRARPTYLDRSYQAPIEASGSRQSDRRAGVLRIPSLRIRTPVDAVDLDHGVMAIPDSPSRIGWLRTTAAVGDRIGASVLSGHVSDRRDRPGALGRLRSVRVGAVISWTGSRGDRHRFVVTAIRRYLRARGVPADLFRVLGPHVLHLVTCADKVRTGGGGFHYTSNLVVSAREVR